jgi:hypothetical protein
MEGSVNFIGTNEGSFDPEEATTFLASRGPNPALAPNDKLPDDTRIWAALQQASGGTWGGCVYDPDQILAALNSRK